MTLVDQSRAGGLALVPPAWVAIVMALSLWGVWSSWPLIYDFDMPDSVDTLVYGSVAVAVVTILWGIWLLVLASTRSHRFPRHFIAWQIAVIAALVVREVYVLVTPDFVFSLRTVVTTLAEIAIGVLCIAILRRTPAAAMPAAPYSNPQTSRPSALVSVAMAVLGLVVGAVAGFGLGLLAGAVIADLTEISCFEGGCGFFAFFVGIAGGLIGSVGGAILAVWLVNRRRKVSAA